MRDDDSFADLAVAVRCAITNMTMSVDQAQMLALRLNSLGVSHASAELKLLLLRLAMAHDLLKKLIPHERDVRALIARNANNRSEARRMDTPNGSPFGRRALRFIFPTFGRRRASQIPDHTST